MGEDGWSSPPRIRPEMLPPDPASIRVDLTPCLTLTERTRVRLLDAAGSGIREFPEKNANLDTSGRGWTAHNAILRNQQVSGSSPLAGSNRINNLQSLAGWAIVAVSALCRQITCTGPQEPALRGNIVNGCDGCPIGPPWPRAVNNSSSIAVLCRRAAALPARCPDCGADVLTRADIEGPAPPARSQFNSLRIRGAKR